MDFKVQLRQSGVESIQVTIPKKIKDFMKLAPGDKATVSTRGRKIIIEMEG